MKRGRKRRKKNERVGIKGRKEEEEDIKGK